MAKEITRSLVDCILLFKFSAATAHHSLTIKFKSSLHVIFIYITITIQFKKRIKFTKELII